MNGTSGFFLFRLALVALIFCTPLTRADSTDAPKHKPDTKLWKSEKEQGETAFKNRQMHEAETHFQAALAEAENFDAKDYRLAESLTEFGELYARTGRFADAEPLLQRAVDIRRSDPKPLIEAEVQFLYGFTCQQLHHNDAAEKAFLRAQELYSRKLGPDHPLAVRCSFYLGAIYGDEQNYAKAEPLLKRCLGLFEHPATRLVNHNVYDPAASKGTEVWIARFRPDSDYALETRVLLGMIYAREGKLSEAEENYKQSIAGYEKALGQDSKALVRPLTAYAALLRKMNRDSEAEAIEARVKSIQGAGK
jgi:tetratricopeptide (TPR) repeat protein